MQLCLRGPVVFAASTVLLASAPAIALRSVVAAQQHPFSAATSVLASGYSSMASAEPSASNGNSDSKGQQIDPKTFQLVRDAQDLFCAKPSVEIFKRSWNPDAIFADPICHAIGFREYAAQWWGMPKAFSESKTLGWELVQSTPEVIEFKQDQHYKVRGLGTVKQMHSLVHIKLDEQGKIRHFEDRWDEKPLPNGSFSMMLRRLNARTMPYIVSVPKEGAQSMKKEL